MRNRRGNMLSLVAITALILVALLFFTLSFLSVTRSHLEQRNAVEAAALAAAQDIGKIVVNTPECGYVGLCDAPPNGETTQAQDNYFCEVRSINELMATARLNLIIATEIGDDFLKQLALEDRQNAINAKDKLETAIQDALKAGGSAKDIHGNDVTPYDDALAVYLKNTAKQSSFVAGSMRLTLGDIDGGIGTQVALPNPRTKASVNPGQTLGGSYLSETDVPYGGKSFVFASTGKQVALGDATKFTTTVAGLPFQVPAAIKVEADQQFVDQDKTYTQHFNACATPGSDVVRPAGGALTISFPDGPIPEINSPQALYAWKEMQDAKVDPLTAINGDFPVDGGSKIGDTPPWAPPPWPSSPPSAADAARVGIHDWLRAGGSRVNIDSVVNMQTGVFDTPPQSNTMWTAKDPITLAVINMGQIPQGIMHIYTFTPQGTILYRSKTIKPYPYLIIAKDQLYTELADGQDLHSTVKKWYLSNVKMNLQGGKPGNGNKGKGGPQLAQVDIQGRQEFDFYMRDMVHQMGTGKGGNHNGEPLDDPAVTSRPRRPADLRVALTGCADLFEIGGKTGGGGAPPIVSRQDDFATSTVPPAPYTKYSKGPAAGAPRPTYTQNGVAVDLRFRRQIDVGELAILLGGVDIGYVGEML